MEGKPFCAAPTSVFSAAAQPHPETVKIFFLHQEKWIHCHFINFGILDRDDTKRPRIVSEQCGRQERKQSLNLSMVINDKQLGGLLNS